MSEHDKALAVVGVSLLELTHKLQQQDARMTELAHRVAGLEALARTQHAHVVLARRNPHEEPTA